MNNHFNFIEIGTSSFDTEIEKANDNTIGLSIEPIKHYLNKLPNKKNCIKLNAAISNYNGTIDIYYVPEDFIVKNKCPDWWKGCNSVNKPHPTIYNFLKSKNIDANKVIKKNTVNVYNIKALIKKYEIKSCDLLKIDTEGHDCVIMQDLINYNKKNTPFLPKVIIFESNELTEENLINSIIFQLMDNYKLIYSNNNTRLELN